MAPDLERGLWSRHGAPAWGGTWSTSFLCKESFALWPQQAARHDFTPLLGWLAFARQDVVMLLYIDQRDIVRSWSAAWTDRQRSSECTSILARAQ